MSSSPKCIPPVPPPSPSSPSDEPWNELAAFRETALRHFTRPEDRACLLRLGELLTESALEQAHLWPSFEGSETESGIAAACRDLHHLRCFLISLGDARHLAVLSPRQHELAGAAARAARLLRSGAGVLSEGLLRYAGGPTRGSL
jgi:hypothetical protein